MLQLAAVADLPCSGSVARALPYEKGTFQED